MAETQLTDVQNTQLKVAVNSMREIMHTQMTALRTGWRRRTVNEEDDRSYTYQKEEVELININGLTMHYFDLLKSHLEPFVRNMFQSMSISKSDEDFLEICLAFHSTYLGRIHKCFKIILQPISIYLMKSVSNDAEVTPDKYLETYLSKTFFDVVKTRLCDCIFSRINRIRQFPYSAGSMYRPLMHDPTPNAPPNQLHKIIYGLYYLFPDDYDELFIRRYITEAKKHMESLKDDLSKNMSLTEFIDWAFLALYTEGLLFAQLGRPSEEEIRSLKKVLSEQICDLHISRMKDKVLPTFAETISSTVSVGENRLGNLFELYYLSENSEIKMKNMLTEEVEVEVLLKLRIHPIEIDRISHQWPLGVFHDFLMSCVQMREDNLFKLQHREVVPPFDNLRCSFSKNHYSLIQDLGLKQKIDTTGEFLVEYLLGMKEETNPNREDDSHRFTRIKDYEDVEAFFIYLANLEKCCTLWETLIKKDIASDRRLRLDRISGFFQMPNVSQIIPNRLLHIVNDVMVSEQQTRWFKDDQLHQVLDFNDRNVDCKIQTFREDWWPGYGDNSIRLPEALRQLHAATEKFTKENTVEMLKVKSIGALSLVTIQCPLFSGRRRYVRLRLPVYQLTVLNLLENEATFSRKKVYEEAIVPIIEEGTDKRKIAEKVVDLVLDSLLNPYPMIKLVADLSGQSKDDIIFLNREFEFPEEDLVHIPAPNLEKEHIAALLKAEQPQTPENAVPERTRRPLKEHMAQNILLGMLRRKKREAEGELLDRVINRRPSGASSTSFSTGIEKEDVDHAIETLTSKGRIKRCEERNISILEYIPEEDEVTEEDKK